MTSGNWCYPISFFLHSCPIVPLPRHWNKRIFIKTQSLSGNTAFSLLKLLWDPDFRVFSVCSLDSFCNSRQGHLDAYLALEALYSLHCTSIVWVRGALHQLELVFKNRKRTLDRSYRFVLHNNIPQAHYFSFPSLNIWIATSLNLTFPFCQTALAIMKKVLADSQVGPVVQTPIFCVWIQISSPLQ